MLEAATIDGERRNGALVSAPRAVCPVLYALRQATADDHRLLEQRLDAVARFFDPQERARLIRRYAALHIPADAALGHHLAGIPDLDFGSRSRAVILARFTGNEPLPGFPAPAHWAEALGMLYVLEGSTLGGRFILRALAERGISDPNLAFLDPYGAETGTRWRGFLDVLAREVRDDSALIAQACRGAVRAFRHAERVLCGVAA